MDSLIETMLSRADCREAMLASLTRLLKQEFGIGAGDLDEGTNPVCPHCGSLSISKRGFDSKRRQRFKCKGCGRSFTKYTSGICKGTKLPLDTWLAFAECHVDAISLRDAARKCSVCVKTAYLMRRRLLAIMQRAYLALLSANCGVPRYLSITYDAIAHPATPVSVFGSKAFMTPGKAVETLAAIIAGVSSIAMQHFQRSGEAAKPREPNRAHLQGLSQSISQFFGRFRRVCKANTRLYTLWFSWLLSMKAYSYASLDAYRLVRNLADSYDGVRRCAKLDLKPVCASIVGAVFSSI